jgi:hypothetical protein
MHDESGKREIIVNRICVIHSQLKQLAPELMQELEATEQALRHLGSDLTSSEDYSGYRRAIDAIEAYLRKVKQPASTSKIVDELVRGGWCAIDTRAPHNVMDSIRYHLKNPQTKKLRLVAGSIMDLKNARVALQDITMPSL